MQTPLPDEIKKVLYARSFIEYIKGFWHIVEPNTPYIHGWHIDAIAEHLQAVTEGLIRNILINMPPRCAKSLLISVFWPTWTWIRFPSTRYIYSSYAQSLSSRDSIKCRRIIDSDLYQRLFGDRYQLTSDQNTKNRFENDKTGYRLSTSVGGSGTGEGGDVLVVDDPQNASEAYSEAKVMATQEWWDNTMSTRGNNPKTVAKVIVMQRLAENDLSGHVIKQGGYEHLMLPMEFESDRKVITSIGWEDPRTEEGELLWPERFDPASIKELKTRLGTYGFAGQMQQRPAPKGGGMFKRAWFEVVRAAPSKFVRVVRYWDRAATEDKPGKDPDYTVGVKMGKDIDGVHYVLDVCRMRESSLKVQTAIKNAATQDGFLCKIGLEQDPGQAGKSEVEYLIRQLAGFNVKAYLVQHNKTTRASPLSAQAEAGNIKLVEGPWNEAFLKELETFPLGDHDDQVDSASGSFNMLNEAGINYEGLTKL